MIPPLELSWLPWPFADGLVVLGLYGIGWCVVSIVDWPAAIVQAVIPAIVVAIVVVLVELTR
jgi:hypothetical protein